MAAKARGQSARMTRLSGRAPPISAKEGIQSLAPGSPLARGRAEILLARVDPVHDALTALGLQHVAHLIGPGEVVGTEQRAIEHADARDGAPDHGRTPLENVGKPLAYLVDAILCLLRGALRRKLHEV